MDADRIRPFGDKVLVKLDDIEQVSKGGIFLPTTRRGYDHEQNMATVIAVGPGRYLPNGRRVELLVKPGDRVLVNRFISREGRNVSSSPVDEDRRLYLIPEDDIHAVIE